MKEDASIAEVSLLSVVGSPITFPDPWQFDEPTCPSSSVGEESADWRCSDEPPKVSVESADDDERDLASYVGVVLDDQDLASCVGVVHDDRDLASCVGVVHDERDLASYVGVVRPLCHYDIDLDLARDTAEDTAPAVLSKKVPVSDQLRADLDTVFEELEARMVELLQHSQAQVQILVQDVAPCMSEKCAGNFAEVETLSTSSFGTTLDDMSQPARHARQPVAPFWPLVPPELEPIPPADTPSKRSNVTCRNQSASMDVATSSLTASDHGHPPCSERSGLSVVSMRDTYRVSNFGRSRHRPSMDSLWGAVDETCSKISDRYSIRKLRKMHVENEYRTMSAGIEYPNSVSTWVKEWCARLGCDGSRLKALVACVCRRRLRCECMLNLVETQAFVTCVSMLTCLNVVVIGISTNYTAEQTLSEYDRHVTVREEIVLPDEMISLDLMFSIMFALELAARIIAYECEYFAGPDWKWNLIDVLLLSISFSEMALITNSTQDFGWLRVFRLLRMARVFRITRLIRWLHFFHSLRLMVVAMSQAIVPLMWGVLVMFLLMYVFSIIFLQAISEYVRDAVAEDTNVASLRMYFNSLPMSMLSLFMAVTGGIDWWDLAQLIMKIHTAYALMFVLYIATMVLGALNIITGIFVHEAVEMASMDKDVMNARRLHEQAVEVQKLRGLFEEIDEAEAGSISKSDFINFAVDPATKAIFEKCGLNVSEPERFFDGLDADGDMFLEIEEFVMGCMRQKGNNEHNSLDLRTVRRGFKENRRLLCEVIRRSDDVRTKCETIERTVEQLSLDSVHRKHALTPLLERIRSASRFRDSDRRRAQLSPDTPESGDRPVERGAPSPARQCQGVREGPRVRIHA